MNLNNWSACPVRSRLLQALVTLCVLVPATLAASPAPYGAYFARLGEVWPDSSASGPGTPGRVTAGDLGAYQRQLAVLEAEDGPYAGALAEPLADLARQYRLSGDLVQAQQAYRRALHVVRVNEGLYSKAQVPILKELFQTYRMSGDMAALDARYDYYFRLYGNGQPPYTSLRIGAALEYLQWQREALKLGLDDEDTQRLLALYSLNERLLAGVENDPAVDYLSYRELALSQLANIYLLQARYDPDIDALESGSRISMAGGTNEASASQRRLETFHRTALAHGRELLAGLVRRAPTGQPEALAAAWLALADWNQWNDRRTEALAGYQTVARVLRESGREQLLREWLGQPVELPANGAFRQSRQAGIVAPVVVQARFDVTARGRARNIEVTALDSEYQGKAGRVRRELKQVRFRPRFVDGEPEAQSQLMREYEVFN